MNESQSKSKKISEFLSEENPDQRDVPSEKLTNDAFQESNAEKNQFNSLYQLRTLVTAQLRKDRSRSQISMKLWNLLIDTYSEQGNQGVKQLLLEIRNEYLDTE